MRERSGPRRALVLCKGWIASSLATAQDRPIGRALWRVRCSCTHKAVCATRAGRDRALRQNRPVACAQKEVRRAQEKMSCPPYKPPPQPHTPGALLT